MAFPDTHWSRLTQIGQREGAERLEALRWFARQYWRPIYHYARALRRGTADDAEDVTQQFFTMLLQRGDLEQLSPERGSVRGFLRVALRHFVTKVDRAANARPRLFSFEVGQEDSVVDPGKSPDEAFDAAWIRQVLDEALAGLRRELRADGREDELNMFEAYCLPDAAPVTYEELAGRFGMKAEDVRNRVRDARRRMVDIVRDVVAEYVRPGESIEDEIDFVLGRR